MILHLVGAQQSNYPWGFENRLIPAIQELGHTLIATDFRQESARLPERLAQPADLILFCKGEGIDPHLIESCPCVTALWYAEQIGTPEAWDDTALARRKELAFNIHAFDHTFSHDPANLRLYKSLGAEKADPLPCAAVDPALNRRLHIPKKFDVVFVGSKTPRRLKILEELARKGIGVYSPDIWNAEEMNRLFNESRIVLNCHLSELLNTETRVAEVLGSGSFLLSETLSDGDLVEEGRHFIGFTPGATDEMIDKIRYYLDHDRQREEIASQGHDHIHHRHTYGHRIRKILDAVDFSANRRIWPAYDIGVPTNGKDKPTLRLDRFNAHVRERLEMRERLKAYGAVSACERPPLATQRQEAPSFDLEKYQNDGWGISRRGFEMLYSLMAQDNRKVLRVLEFGSGISTAFFSDLSTILNKEIFITSFDNDSGYMYSGAADPRVTVHLRDLEETDDLSFERMFSDRTYHQGLMHKKTTPLTSRQRNNFYGLKPDDLTGTYDYMLLDGPNGNGRSLAFLHTRPHLEAGSIVFIDDFTHYDFVEKFKEVFDSEELYKHIGGGIDRWHSGGDFIIFRINGLTA